MRALFAGRLRLTWVFSTIYIVKEWPRLQTRNGSVTRNARGMQLSESVSDIDMSLDSLYRRRLVYWFEGGSARAEVQLQSTIFMLDEEPRP